MLTDRQTKETGAASKATGGLFKALKRLTGRQEATDLELFELRQDMLYRLSRDEAVSENLRGDVRKMLDFLVAKDVWERKTTKWNGTLEGVAVVVFLATGSLAGYDLRQHRQDLAALSSKIDNLYPYMANDWDHDEMALLGLPAKIECSQVLDGEGGVDIRFTSVRTPVAGSNNGSSTTTNGTLKADGRLEWKITTKELDGTEGTLPGSDKSVRPAAAFCKKALTGAPGVAG